LIFELHLIPIYLLIAPISGKVVDLKSPGILASGNTDSLSRPLKTDALNELTWSQRYICEFLSKNFWWGTGFSVISPVFSRVDVYPLRRWSHFVPWRYKKYCCPMPVGLLEIGDELVCHPGIRTNFIVCQKEQVPHSENAFHFNSECRSTCAGPVNDKSDFVSCVLQHGFV